MKLLVTSATGQLARSLVRRVAGHPGIELIAVGRPELDLEIPGSADAVIRRHAPDVLINAAAFTDVDRAEDEPDRAFRINADGAGEVARTAAALDVPLIHVSTDYVFDGSARGAYAEDAQTNPLGAYGRSKLASEEQVRAACSVNTIVRTAWVYSPFGRNFVRTIFEAAGQHDELRVVADQRGSPTSALDLADGLLVMVNCWRGGERTGQGKTYHIAGSGEASWHDLAVAVMEERARLGLRTARVNPITTDQWPTRARRPRNSVLANGKFEGDFGFRMPAWRQSVAEVVASW